MILGRMSSGLLPRVYAFGVPGHGKTHGHSGFENDFEDLVTDLLAAFVANDVPATFCAPEVFVDAAMIASDSGVSMLGAALSAFEDAAMLCSQKSEWNGEIGGSYLVKNEGFLERFLELSGVLLIMANSGSSFFVSPCGLMASMYGVFLGLLAEMGGCDSCCIGEIAELNGCCSSAPGPGEAADLLCSGQLCDLFERQYTHFSSWSLLPVHTIISDGATGFAGPLGHVAAAALLFDVHSGLPAASAAKATEYMLEPAAASVAAFLLDGQTDLLPVPAAKAFHNMECQSNKQTLQAAAAAAAILVGSPFVAIVLHMSEWCRWILGWF